MAYPIEQIGFDDCMRGVFPDNMTCEYCHKGDPLKFCISVLKDRAGWFICPGCETVQDQGHVKVSRRPSSIVVFGYIYEA